VRLLKDPAFPDSPTTSKRHIKPRNGRQLTQSQQLYDIVQSAGRQCVENMFADLTNRFRITKGCIEIGGSMWHARLTMIIKACLILHNLCLDFKDKADFEGSDSESSDSSDGEHDHECDIPSTSANVRNAIMLYISDNYELNGRSYKARA